MSVDLGLLPSLLATGFALGWSVAWPPGPINAEMIRRGLAQGFWPSYRLCLGACTGDGLWAVSVAFGAGLLLSEPWARGVLGIVSTVLLFLLSALFLRAAWHGWTHRRDRHPSPPSTPLAARSGYFLGFTMAMTSPWNVAFWVAVLGQSEMANIGIAATLVVAAAVLAGAGTWGVLLAGAVTGLRLRIDTAKWEIVAGGLTGLLMLYFALRSALRLTLD
jgi:threonine/homoserine/homoserine lactone efflux protein